MKSTGTNLDVLTICLHRSGKGGRENWVLFFGVQLRPPFPPSEAGRYVYGRYKHNCVYFANMYGVIRTMNLYYSYGQV